MKINLLIATLDSDYAEHFSSYLSEKYKDTFFVSLCREPRHLQEQLASAEYDVVLLDASLAEGVDLRPIRMPLVLRGEDTSETAAFAAQTNSDSSQDEHTNEDLPQSFPRGGKHSVTYFGTQSESQCAPKHETALVYVDKYRRISSIVSSILEGYAKITTDESGLNSGRARITAVWSPAGGVGKTTIALARAVKASSDGKKALYLNMENFCSAPAFFRNEGKSISAVFEMLEKNEGNLKMLIQAVMRQDTKTGVSYFRLPDNYDDMNILSVEDVTSLITACSCVADELVIDLSSLCDNRTRQIFKLADKVMLVIDQKGASQAKLRQFMSQHSVYEQIKTKVTLVANRDCSYDEPFFSEIMTLPEIPTADMSEVSRTLSGCLFDSAQASVS